MVGLFHTLVMSCILYVLPMWSGCLSAELIGQINSLLKQAHKFGFSSTLYTVENMADVADKALFEKILAERHCLHGFLFTKKVYDRLRPRGHSFELPSCTHELPRCWHKYIWWGLIRVFSWLVFEECPLGAGSLFAHIFILFHCSYIIKDVFVILCLTFLGYIVSCHLKLFLYGCMYVLYVH